MEKKKKTAGVVVAVQVIHRIESDKKAHRADNQHEQQAQAVDGKGQGNILAGNPRQVKANGTVRHDRHHQGCGTGKYEQRQQCGAPRDPVTEVVPGFVHTLRQRLVCFSGPCLY
jgi:hypothetical protein